MALLAASSGTWQTALKLKWTTWSPDPNEMSEVKLSRTIEVINPQGLHVRPVDLIVKAANRFQSKVEIVKGQQRVDAKSMWAIFTLGALQGTELVVEADGPDAAEAIEALCELFERGFDELKDKSEDT